MKNLVTCGILVVLASISVAGQIIDDRFRSPWKNQTRALVIDGNSDNDIDWTKIISDPRVAGMIFRASPMKNKISNRWELKADEGYAARKEKAKKLGYRWGSFHVGVRDIDPVEQAKFYLETAKPADDEVMALDLEDISKPEYMDLDQAIRFIDYIKEATGRYPMVYVTGSIHDAIFRRFGKSSVFSRVPLWYVRVENDISRHLKNSSWDSYTLWQFSSELNCCQKINGRRICNPPKKTCPFGGRAPIRRIPGVDLDIDVNIYYGTVEELKSNWPFTFRNANRTSL